MGIPLGFSQCQHDSSSNNHSKTNELNNRLLDVCQLTNLKSVRKLMIPNIPKSRDCVNGFHSKCDHAR